MATAGTSIEDTICEQRLEDHQNLQKMLAKRNPKLQKPSSDHALQNVQELLKTMHLAQAEPKVKVEDKVIVSEWVVLNANGATCQGAATAKQTAVDELSKSNPGVVFIAEPIGASNIRESFNTYRTANNEDEVFIAIKSSEWDTVDDWSITKILTKTLRKTIELSKEKLLESTALMYNKLFHERTIAVSANKYGTINRLVCIHSPSNRSGVSNEEKLDVLVHFLQILWDEHIKPPNPPTETRPGSVIVGGDFNVDLFLLASKLCKETDAFTFDVVRDRSKSNVTGLVHLYSTDSCSIALTKDEALKFAETFDHPFVFVQASILPPASNM